MIRPNGKAVSSRPHRIVGRSEEERLLAAALEGAAGGAPCAFLIHGEAGVGKTRLVQQVCDHARQRGFAILWGRCVRFDAIEAPYNPLLKALSMWVQDADPEARTRVLGGAANVEEFAERVTNRRPVGTAGMFAAIDAAVAELAAQAPTILVVDDLQWADLASRDSLAYLIAGFHQQRLAVLSTYRDEALAAGDPLHRWLADARRLPAVTDLPLARLNAAETEEQLHLLLGRAPHPSLVADVMDRSSGNPYLSELMVHGLASDAERLPPGVPDVLSEALLSAWHQLPRPSRAVLGILSVAGRPATSTDLADVLRSRGLDPATCHMALREAADRGIVVGHGHDVFWFRHPLLAEVLYGTFSISEVGPIHAAWARKLESEASRGVDEVRRQGDLARHYEECGDLLSSLEASLRAAHLAEELHAVREAAQHLQRAVRLWPKVHDDEEGRCLEGGLLERAARASRRVGDGEASLAAWDRALELVDERTDPLRACRLILEWDATAWEMGVRDDDDDDCVAELTRAIELSQVSPDSSEYAESLADLSQTESWLGRFDQAALHADEAIAAAHRSQSPRALCAAHTARAYANSFSDERAGEDTRAALSYALDGQNPEQICWAYVARGNFHDARGALTDTVAVALEGFVFARNAGEISMTAFMSGSLTRDLLQLGRLAEAGEVVREGLSRSALSNSAAAVRLAAALLSIRRGQLPAADLHMKRAKELIRAIERRPGLVAPPVMAEHELARGQPDKALKLLMDTLAVQAVDPRVADEMLMWAARAAADLAQRSRDHRDATGPATAVSALQDLVALRHEFTPPPFAVVAVDDPVQPAVEALFNAELRRCESVAGTAAVWEEGVHRCEAAGMRWQAEVSRLRWGQALAAEGATRSTVAQHVRVGHKFCTDVGAEGLQRDFEALAKVCGVTLDEPVAASPPSGEPRFSALTRREREVLGYLVAGRTYGEIADSLFISEKTVSAHVSNLLRKTDTSSRREVAALAQRLGADADHA